MAEGNGTPPSFTIFLKITSTRTTNSPINSPCKNLRETIQYGWNRKIYNGCNTLCLATKDVRLHNDDEFE